MALLIYGDTRYGVTAGSFDAISKSIATYKKATSALHSGTAINMVSGTIMGLSSVYNNINNNN